MEVPAEERRRQHESDKAMRRLKPSEIKAYREELLEKQGGECALCHLPLSTKEAVLDHDHKTGIIRGVLHRGCNCLLGKNENNHRRYAIPVSLPAYLLCAAGYLHGDPMLEQVYHPSYRTPEEKRLLRNKRARRKRKAKKAE